MAESLVGQAVIALENARLHSIVERQASIDGLTGVSNRRAGEHALRAELSRVERFGGELTLILSDLDDFKMVNDRYGHPTGDAVLREFSAALRTEAARVPRGRVAFLRRYGAFDLAIKAAPFRG